MPTFTQRLRNKAQLPGFGAQPVEAPAIGLELSACGLLRQVRKFVDIESGQALVVVDTSEIFKVFIEVDGAVDVAVQVGWYARAGCKARAPLDDRILERIR